MAEERDSVVGSYLGIPHFSWDIIAHIMPGMVGLAVVWGFVLDKHQAQEIKNALHQVFPWWWLAIIGVAYLLGLVISYLTYPLTSKYAKHWMGECEKHSKPFSERLTVKANIDLEGNQKANTSEEIDEAKWQALFRIYSTNRDKWNEAVWVEKSQIQSRAMSNISLLLLFSGIAALITRVCAGRGYSLIGSRISEFQFWALIVFIFLTSYLCRSASKKGQRRRILGMVNIFRDVTKESGAAGGA